MNPKSKTLCLILGIAISLPAFANENTFIYANSDRSKKLSYTSIKEIRISASDDCKNKKCLAYKAATEKLAMPKSIPWVSGGANPTSTLCTSLEATPSIAYFENRDEVSICVFKDNSFIFGWDLMRIYKGLKN